MFLRINFDFILFYCNYFFYSFLIYNIFFICYIIFNAKSIAETSFDVTKGKRFKFEFGIYSTPDTHNNEVYLLVFQNRVNPDTLVRINTNIGEYWLSPKDDDIRPYGICFKKLS